jgi:hypothetical protein
LNQAAGWYYLDNTPTLGSPNDAINATGTIHGHVCDTLGQPIAGVRVTYDYNLPDVYSNASGDFSINGYARRVSLYLRHPNFHEEVVPVQVLPESTIAVTLMLQRIVGVQGRNDLANGPLHLRPNYPNPFNPGTMITYEIPGKERIELKVFDVQGREVATLANTMVEQGSHSVLWDASGLPSGIYFCRLQSGTTSRAIKMLLMR